MAITRSLGPRRSPDPEEVGGNVEMRNVTSEPEKELKHFNKEDQRTMSTNLEEVQDEGVLLSAAAPHNEHLANALLRIRN